MSQQQAGSRRPTIGFELAILAIAVTIALLVASWVQLRESRATLRRADAKEQRLVAIRLKLKNDKRAISSSQRRVIQVLRHCRSAEDIPALDGGRIASVMNDSRGLVMHVPDGEYELLVDCYWILPRDEQQKRTWTVPLSGAAGYLFQVRANSPDAPPSWSLSSSDQLFAERSEQLSERTFSENGTSANFHEWFCFPNTINDFGRANIQALINDPPPIPVFDVAYTQSTYGEQELEFRVMASLRSHNPPCVLSRDYVALIRLGEENRVMPYQGDGVHFLRTDAKPE